MKIHDEDDQKRPEVTGDAPDLEERLDPEMTAILRSLVAVEEVPVPDGLTDRIMARIQAVKQQESEADIPALNPVSTSTRSPLRHWLPIAAAILVILLAIPLVQQMRPEVITRTPETGGVTPEVATGREPRTGSGAGPETGVKIRPEVAQGGNPAPQNGGPSGGGQPGSGNAGTSAYRETGHDVEVAMLNPARMDPRMQATLAEWDQELATAMETENAAGNDYPETTLAFGEGENTVGLTSEDMDSTYDDPLSALVGF